MVIELLQNIIRVLKFDKKENLFVKKMSTLLLGILLLYVAFCILLQASLEQTRETLGVTTDKNSQGN